MKKILSIIMTAAVVMAVSGCSSYNKDNSSSSRNPSSSGSISSTVSDIGDKVNSGVENIIGNGNHNSNNNPNSADYGIRTYEDGTYRGAFVIPQEMDVTFDVKDNKFTRIEFNSLGHNGKDFLKENGNTVVGSYKELADYLIGKDVHDLKSLHKPENIITDMTNMENKDMIVGGKLVSALNDGLNRGVYMVNNAMEGSSSSAASDLNSSSNNASKNESSSSSSSSSSSQSTSSEAK